MTIENVIVTQEATNVTVSQPEAPNVNVQTIGPLNVSLTTPGPQGIPGPAGAPGTDGTDGADGATGPAPNLSGINVITLAPGTSATGSITGDNPNYTINLSIPRGDVGPQGPQGEPGSGSVDTVNGDPGPDVVLTASSVGAVAIGDAVLLTTNQSINGIKTFVSSPIIPSPTTDSQAANKIYVDDGLDTKANTSHVHDAADINSGTLAIGVIPTGTTGTTVALGHHLHTGVYEPVITAGTTSQYLRGDKSWQTLDKSAVGLNNVDNTSDANKPVSTAQQTALNLKANLASPTFTGAVTVPDSSFTIAKTTGLQTALDGKLATGLAVLLTGNQTVAGIKTFSSSPVVPDASFAISKVTNLQTTLDGKAAATHTHVINDVTGLQAALDGKASTSHNHDSAYVALTGAQTIAGIKTFSSSPVVPDSSFTIAKTTGLQTALDGKAASVHNHDDLYYTESEITTLLAGKADLSSGVISNSQLPPRLRQVFSANVLTNLNEGVYTGWYFAESTASNSPMATYAYLNVYNLDGGAILQEWTAAFSTERYERRFTSGAWDAWVRTYSRPTELDARYPLLTSGLVDKAVLGSGAGTDGTKYLADDRTWKTVSSGSPLLASTSYAPGSNTNLTTSSTSVVDVDATNLVLTFTVPASGAVLLRLTGNHTSGNYPFWCVRNGTTTVSGSISGLSNGAYYDRKTHTAKITGLTPGASLTWKWAWKSTSGIIQLSVGSAGTDAQYGPAVMEVWAA